MLTAITRDVSDQLGKCELTFQSRVGIDTQLAIRQHQEYQSALASLGCEIVTVPAAPELPDSVFVEDTAIVLDEVAVMCMPGAESRRPELAGVAEALQPFRSLERIELPGTLDGGDLLRVGNVVYAGLSTRSNHEGIEQLRNITGRFGYSVETVETNKCLHLKSAATQIAPDTLLINPDWVDRTCFGGLELIEVSGAEPHAANALRIGTSVVYPSAFPRTLEDLRRRGLDVVTVDLSELQKAEGAITCCSLIVESK
ncbi:MAG: arginine deiminase-related protein [Woeseiaceae bacterium]|nr:arginine deiminase-related protein [Woeseiaceae bacterium]